MLALHGRRLGRWALSGPLVWRLCNTGGMTVAVTVDRSGPAVLEALRALSPDEAEAFQSEYRATLGRASDSLDLAEAERVLTHWWGIASLRLNPLTEPEREAGATLPRGR